jgi:hypothetical protein
MIGSAPVARSSYSTGQHGKAGKTDGTRAVAEKVGSIDFQVTRGTTAKSF